jgi:hypothetical protein
MRFLVIFLVLIPILSKGHAYPEGARYLIITHDDFYEAVLPLAEWKTQKGMLARVVKTSEIGSSQYQIKNFISDAYNNWEIPPEYVLLVGDQYHIPFPSSLNDHYYAMIDGDVFDDVMIGRFPAANLSQVQTMVAKVLGYEKDPYMEDTLWFRKGTTIVREDGQYVSDSIYWSDAHYAAGLMVNAGYVHVDSFSSFGGNNAQDVINAINDGRTFVLYRGQGVGYWWSPFAVYPSSTNNGFKLPVVVSATCATLGMDDLGEEFMRVGTPANPKGAVGFIGTTTIGSGIAHIRSAIAKGFFKSVFEDRINILGDAFDGARRYLYDLFGAINDYYGFTLYGDPELNLWTATPSALTVSFPPAIPLGNIDFTVSVSSSSGNALPGALVCVKMDTLVYSYGYTGPDGSITFSLDIPDTGTLLITVTARNFKPYIDSASVIVEGPYLALTSYSLEELTGNGDGFVNPGESFTVNIKISNIGNDTSFNATGFLRSGDPYITLIDTVEDLGTLAPGDTVEIENAFSFQVSSLARDGHLISLDIFIEDSSGNTWNSIISNLLVMAPKISIIGVEFIDTLNYGNGNGIPEPGEFIEIIPTFVNSGHAPVSNLVYSVSEGDTSFSVSDPNIFIGILNPGDTIAISDDPIRGAIHPFTSMGEIELLGLAVGSGQTYVYTDTLPIDIPVLSSAMPTGPDNYGYYAYDDTDVLSGQSPTFDWVEIAPPGPGEIISEITNDDADTVTLPLPFTFKFYGIEYDSIGVCSNGFLELGRATYRFGYNDSIPSPGGPKRLLAPFWCDLDPSQNGDIYQWYDENNHRWIVEFKNVVHYGGNYPETFEVILYDPLYYPTPTGDGIIVFQYLTVSNPNVCTIGIEDHTETDGIEYLYNGSYGPGAASMVNHRAIKFSTSVPQGVSTPWITMNPIYFIFDTLTGNGNGIPEEGETFSLNIILRNWGNVAAEDMEVHLSSVDGASQVIDSFAFYGTIAPGDSLINTDDPFIVSVPTSPSDTILDFSLLIRANNGDYENLILFSIPLDYNVGIEGSGRIPTTFLLSQNYPNPWEDVTFIEFSIPKRTAVEITIYDISGRKIRTLLREVKNPGFYRINWNGRDDRGLRVPSGIYFLRVVTEDNVATRKMVLIGR